MIDPFKWERCLVRSTKFQHKKFIECGGCPLSETPLGFDGFLGRMRRTSLSSGPVFSVALEASVTIGTVDAHNSDGDWVSSAAFELRHLVPKIIDDTVDLLNHRFRQDFHFRADLHSRDLTPPDREARLRDRMLSGNEFAKCPVSSPCSNSSANISKVDDPLSGRNARS